MADDAWASFWGTSQAASTATADTGGTNSDEWNKFWGGATSPASGAATGDAAASQDTSGGGAAGPPAPPQDLVGRIWSGVQQVRSAGGQVPSDVSDYLQQQGLTPEAMEVQANSDALKAVGKAAWNAVSWLGDKLARPVYAIDTGIKHFEDTLNQGGNLWDADKALVRGAWAGLTGAERASMGEALNATKALQPVAKATEVTVPLLNSKVNLLDALGFAGDWAMMEATNPLKAVGAAGAALKSAAPGLAEKVTTGTQNLKRWASGLFNWERGMAPEYQAAAGEANAAMNRALRELAPKLQAFDEQLKAEGIITPEQRFQWMNEQFLKGRAAEKAAREVVTPEGAANAAFEAAGKEPPRPGEFSPIPEVSQQHLHAAGVLRGLDHQALHDLAEAAGYKSLKDPEARRAVLAHLRFGNETPEAVKANADVVRQALKAGTKRAAGAADAAAAAREADQVPGVTGNGSPVEAAAQAPPTPSDPLGPLRYDPTLMAQRTELEQRIGNLQARLRTLTDPATEARLSELQRQLDEVNGRLYDVTAANANAFHSTGLTADQAATSAVIDANNEAIRQQMTVRQQNIAALQRQIADIEAANLSLYQKQIRTSPLKLRLNLEQAALRDLASQLQAPPPVASGGSVVHLSPDPALVAQKQSLERQIADLTRKLPRGNRDEVLATRRAIEAAQQQLEQTIDQIIAQNRALPDWLPKPGTPPEDFFTGTTAADLAAKRGALQIRLNEINRKLTDPELSQDEMLQLYNEGKAVRQQLQDLESQVPSVGFSQATSPRALDLTGQVRDLSWLDTLKSYKDIPIGRTAEETYQNFALALPKLENLLPEYETRAHYIHLGSIPTKADQPRTLADALRGALTERRGFMLPQESEDLSRWAARVRAMGREPILDPVQSIAHRAYYGLTAQNTAEMLQKIATNPELAMPADEAEKAGLLAKGWVIFRPDSGIPQLSNLAVRPDIADAIQRRALGAALYAPASPAENALVRLWDAIQNTHRSLTFFNPVVHGKNLLVNAIMAGLNPIADIEHFRAALTPEVQDALVRYGAVAPERGFRALLENAGVPMKESGTLGKVKQGLRAVSQWNRDTVHGMENWYKGALFSKLTSHGVAPEEAAARAALAFGDPGLFDQRRARQLGRIFYTPSWTVNNLAFQLQNMVEHPGRYAALRSLLDAINRASVGYGTEQNGPGKEISVATPLTNQQGVHFFLTPNLPVDEPNKLADNPVAFLVNRLAPIPRIGLDLALGAVKAKAPSITHGLDYSSGVPGPLFGYGAARIGPNGEPPVEGPGPMKPLFVQQAVQDLLPGYAGEGARAATGTMGNGAPPWTLLPQFLLGMYLRPYDPQKAATGRALDILDALQTAAKQQGIRLPTRAPHRSSGGRGNFTHRATPGR